MDLMNLESSFKVVVMVPMELTFAGLACFMQ